MPSETDSPPESAIIFPGISQATFADVARFLVINPAARTLAEEASDALGYNLIDRYQQNDGGYTEYSRAAFLVSCLALATWSAREYGAEPRLCAGPSFGGTAAAVWAGALSFPDAIRLTAKWSRCIEDYFAGEEELVTLSFARTPPDQLAEIRAELDERGEWQDIACYVDEDFHMLSVRAATLEWLQERVRAAGGFPLDTISPPLHSARFAPLRDRLEQELLSELNFTDPATPVVCDHDGRIIRDAAGVHQMVLDAIVSPVRWPDVVATLRGHGVQRLYVSGQDSLWGRVPCTTSSFDVVLVNPKIALQPRRRRAIV